MASNRSHPKTTNGNVASWKTAIPAVAEAVSDNDGALPSTSTSATDTESTEISNDSPSESLSAISTTMPGRSSMVWKSPALSYLTSPQPLKYPDQLDPLVQRKLNFYCAGTGMDLEQAVRAMLDFLDGGGMALQADSLEDAVTYYLNNWVIAA